MPTLPHVSRRQFLAGTAGVGVAGASALAAAQRPIERALGLTSSPAPTKTGMAGAASSGPAGKGILVLVTLYGGNDGLNTVIPFDDPAYLGGRPTLGYAASEVLPLDPHLALHPNLGGLKALWDAKKLGVVLGVGYPNPNRSHFRSMDIWQSAVPESDEISGWVGRWLDGAGTDPMRALSFGPTLPKLLRGNKTSGAALPGGTLTLAGGQPLQTSFSALDTVFPGESLLAGRVAQSGKDLLTVAKTVGEILANEPATNIGSANLEPGAGSAPTTSTTPPRPAAAAGGQPTKRPPAKKVQAGLAGQLDLVARLIRGGSPTRVYVVSLGGFDTHAAEKQNHAKLMTELGTGIADFLHTIETDPRASGVVVMSMSEFGRRVNENGSGGTDHGTAGPLFVAGQGVKGGFYGQQPSLTNLDNGDLKFSVDFRSVYATVMDKVLGIDPKSALQGQTFPTLGFV